MFRVLIITPFINASFAGWSKFTLRLVEGIKDKADVSLAIASNEVLPSGVSSHVLGGFKVDDKLGKVLFVIKAWFRLLRNRKSFDCIFLPNLYFYSLIIILAKPFVRARFIARVCANELNHIEVSNSFKKWLLGKFDRIVVLNKETKRRADILGVPSKKVAMIPNPVSPFYQQGHRSEQKYDFLFVGEINPRKGVKRLLKSFFELRSAREFSDITMCLVGPVTDQVYFDKLKKQFDFTENVHISYLGYKTKEELRKIYYQSGIFVLPSYSEGMPNVLLEAMSTGLPVIGTRIPGIIENIDNGKTGLLFENDESLALAMRTLLTSHELRVSLGKSGERFVSTERNPTFIFDKYLDTFSNEGEQ